MECPLNTLTAGDFTNNKTAVKPPVALGDHHTFIGLNTLTCSLNHIDTHDHCVTGRKFGDSFAKASDFFLLKGLDQIHDVLK